jgi:hypothetical protein
MNERRTGLQRWLMLTAKSPVGTVNTTEVVAAV